MKYLSVLLLLLFCGCVANKSLKKSEKIEVQRIWDKAPHNAFTDLLRFKNNFYCTFREGPAHVSGPNGNVRILISPDGKNWQSIASFKLDGKDARDPKLSITPDKRIMVLTDIETYKDGKVETRKPYVCYSDKNGENFSLPEPSIVDPKIAVKSDWVWHVTWNKGIGYAIDYQPDAIYLVKTLDGKYFEKVSTINVDGFPNESTIRFDKKGKMYILIRREGGDQKGVLAISDYPYSIWHFNKLDQRLGGPDFIFLNANTLCLGSRYFPVDAHEQKKINQPKTAVFIVNLEGKVLKIISLDESGGDTSYPGMLIYKNKLWLSYYSSHEGKTSIYLAKLPLSMLKR
jgi:hypothetical protein